MRGLPHEIIAAEAWAFRSRPIRWKRSTSDFVDSHCGFWHITPIYGGLTRPESYELWFGAETRRRVGGGQTQRECKATAEDDVPERPRVRPLPGGDPLAGRLRLPSVRRDGRAVPLRQPASGAAL